MKRIKVLGSVLKRTRADKIIIGFIVFIFAIAAVIQLVEPDINRYGDALWYCYAVISTAGFGDVVAVTFIGKMCSVLLTIYSLFVVAIATGICQSDWYPACTGLSIPGFRFPYVSPQFCHTAVQESPPVVHRLRLSSSP